MLITLCLSAIGQPLLSLLKDLYGGLTVTERTTAIGVLAAPGRCRSEKATGIVGIIYLFCLPCSPFPCLGLQLVGTVSHVCRMRTFMHGSPASS